ncbi:hypothetical protein P775_08245 [Puniceibacterium antarcticum]|uniref:Uncharacterized protein n=1 Tax=Puniceibacterium antarcticum TaxID=1206336 RepID=A0A2G8RG48_9RHOB|nr:hypothetical protein [Puniceibacterium antarcticum]PIL20509.1 hypothetical protein P775_08245 [Puniceibacterium antarcticum]
MTQTTYAHCSRDGLISFSARQNHPGLICIGSGGAAFRNLVDIRARHAKDSDALIVPGVPEAASDADALECVAYFTDWLAGMTPADLSKKYDAEGIMARALAQIT